VGENLSNVGSWLRKSVSSVTGASDEKPASAGSKAGGNGQSFKAFEGTGRTLGSSEAPSPSPAAEAAMRRALQAGSGGQAPRAQAAQATSAAQVADDEALARQLQEQFLLEDQNRR